MNNILYRVHNNLYVNLTNRCPCACAFCLRQSMDRIGESDSLWLDREPEMADIENAFQAWPPESYDDLVFCGFGEPTEALDMLKRTAAYVKSSYGKRIRLNTNGLGDLINGRSIAPELKGLVDTVSISLNTPDEDSYLALVRPRFGAGSYQALLSFARSCVSEGLEVVLTTVDTTLTAEQESECAAICASVGARYRIREWEG